MQWSKLEIECVEVGEPNVRVFRLSGGLTGGAESYQFLEDMRIRMRKNPCPVILNLEKVEHINSAGVGILAACYTSGMNAGKPLALSNVSGRIKTILEVVKLSDVLSFFPTEKEAIEDAAK